MSNFDRQAGRTLPHDPSPTGAQAQADDLDVIAAVQGMAELVSDVDDLDTVLTNIAEFAVTAVPSADGAGVTVVDPDAEQLRVLSWAATESFVGEIDRLQYEVCDEGPCLTAMQTRRGLISGSLGSDDRWPRFGARVARLDVHSALSLPLIVAERVVGALNIYARERDAFTEHALRLGEQFARSAAASVTNIQALRTTHTRATQLQGALTSRAVIDQAIGILRSRTGVSAAEAFDRLREISRAENVKLALVAEQLVDEASRRARTRRHER